MSTVTKKMRSYFDTFHETHVAQNEYGRKQYLMLDFCCLMIAKKDQILTLLLNF